MTPEEKKWSDEAFDELTTDELASGSLKRAGSVARGVITELNLLRDWIKSGDGYNRDDAPDEIARAIANRIREIEARETTQPPNAELNDRRNQPES